MSDNVMYGVKLIAAVGSRGQLGLNGGLPWIKAEGDLGHFKRMTMGDTVICGRKTYENLPPLPGRNVVSWSKRGTVVQTHDDKMVKVEGNPSTAIGLMQRLVPMLPTTQFWVIGGAEVYREFILSGLVYRSVITHIDYNGPADTHFPFDAYGAPRGTKAVQETAVPRIHRNDTERTLSAVFANPADYEEVDPKVVALFDSAVTDDLGGKAEPEDKKSSGWTKLGRYLPRWP